MKSFITVVLVLTLGLVGCGQTIKVMTPGGTFVEFDSAKDAHMYYEYQLAKESDENKWETIASLETDNHVAGMATAFALGQNEVPSMSRFKAWDERLLPWAQMFLGWGGGLGNLLGETGMAGNQFKVEGNDNTFQFWEVDAGRDIGFQPQSHKTISNTKTITTDYDRTDNETLTIGE